MKYAFECSECSLCGEPYCDECKMHYADCKHPGPHSEDDDEDAVDTMMARQPRSASRKSVPKRPNVRPP